MKKALYSGSFDPLTKGHLNIIKRASKVFDHVSVAVMINPNKQMLCDLNIRKDSLMENVKHLENVDIITGDGLTVNFAKAIGANVLIRGVRSVKDYEYEEELANANRWMEEGIETVLFFSDPKYSFISSSLIKEMASYGKDVSEFVPEDVAKFLMEAGKK